MRGTELIGCCAADAGVATGSEADARCDRYRITIGGAHSGFHGLAAHDGEEALFDGGDAAVAARAVATVVGGGDDEPFFVGRSLLNRLKNGTDLLIDHLDGRDVLRRGGTEGEAMTGVVHIVELEEDHIRITSLQQGNGRIGDSLVGSHIQLLIGLCGDDRIDGRPMRDAAQVQRWVHALQAREEVGPCGELIVGEAVVHRFVFLFPNPGEHGAPAGGAPRGRSGITFEGSDTAGREPLQVRGIGGQ